MPPKNKFTKEQIIDAAFEIAKEEGMDGITIRKVASKLESSIAPIYVNFKEVDELKEEVMVRIQEISDVMIGAENSGDQFLDVGIASIKFAKEYSVLFKDFLLKGNSFLASFDSNMEEIMIGEMKKDPELGIFSDEELKMLILKLRVFQAGLSIMATNEVFASKLTDEKIIEMLEETGTDVFNGMMARKSNL